MGAHQNSTTVFYFLLGIILIVGGTYICYGAIGAIQSGTLIPATGYIKESSGWSNLVAGALFILLGGRLVWAGYKGKKPIGK